MDELITRHTEIMSRYDPEHKVGLVVDEWVHGTMWNRARTRASCISRIPCATPLSPL